jgi:hypothetical protein
MLTVMISLMFYGPIETPVKPTATIYIDKTSKDYYIRRRSLMVEHELNMPLDNIWLQKERIYIHGNYNLKIVDVMDLKSFPRAREFPCIKLGKYIRCKWHVRVNNARYISMDEFFR